MYNVYVCRFNDYLIPYIAGFKLLLILGSVVGALLLIIICGIHCTRLAVYCKRRTKQTTKEGLLIQR